MKKRTRRGLTMLEVMIASIILVFIVGIAFVVLSSATSQATNESANMVLQEKARKLIDEISDDLRMADSTTLHKYPNVTGTVGISNAIFTDVANGNATTPIDPLSGPPYASSVPTRAKCPTVPTVTTNYTRYYQIEFDTQKTDSGNVVSGSDKPVNTFDFGNSKPKFTRHVIYTQDLDIAPFGGGTVELADGLDQNKNGLIDERVLWKTEYVAPATSGTARRVASNLRSVAFEIPTTATTRNRVIIHVVFQGADSKGKNLFYYTSSTVTLRN